MLDLLDPASYDELNWAEHVDEDTLKRVGMELCDDVEKDAASREGWLEETEMWLDMAAQVIEEKTTPWEGASNVKFPLLTTAALQFHARSQEELFRSDRVMKGKPLGGDADGRKAKRGKRVESAMSNQLLYEMDDWQEDMDRLLFVLPLVGTVFRKVYWSSRLDRPASELVLPSDLIVNFWATDWERCRKTHSIQKTRNEIIELQRLGTYLEVDVPLHADEPTEHSEDDSGELPEDADPNYSAKDIPFTIFETHAWWDLDKDGYEEPYIVTVLKDTQAVLSIQPRFTTDHIQTAVADDRIARITALEYILSYKFLPDVDSSVYGSGLGKLIGPSNAAIDSIINQLMDSGTMATMPSGFYGRGVRLMRGGDVRFQPGEWQQVNSSGEDLQKNFWPLPVKEPSAVLFNLLGMLIQAGERIGAVHQSMGGQNPGQNQAHGTTQDVMEQGMQVFLGIYKRVYRSLTKEFRLLYQLNYLYLSPEAYNELIDLPPEQPEQGPDGRPMPPEPPPTPDQDFSPKGLDVVPEADPAMANTYRKQRRAQSLTEARRAGMPLNDDYITRIFLESIDEPDPEAAMKAEPPPPSDKDKELEMRQKELEFKYKELQIESEFRVNEPIQDIARAMEHLAKARSLDAQADTSEMEAQLSQMMEQAKAEREERKSMLDLHFQQQTHAQDARAAEVKLDQDRRAGEQKLEHADRMADQKLEAARAQANVNRAADRGQSK